MLGLTTSGAAGSDPAASPFACAKSALCATGFWSPVLPMNTPARTQANTNNASRARIGGSNLLSRRNVSTTPLPRSAARRPTHRKLATGGLLSRLRRSRRCRFRTRRHALRLEVDVSFYLHRQIRFHGRTQRRALCPSGGSGGLLDIARVVFTDDRVAAVCNVGYRHQPGEVTRSHQEVLHLIVCPIELHCNGYDLVVATTGRGDRRFRVDRELGHLGSVGDLLDLDDERRNLRLGRDSLAEFEELAFDIRGISLDLLELVYLLLQLVELGLFVLPRLGLFVKIV